MLFVVGVLLTLLEKKPRKIYWAVPVVITVLLSFLNLFSNLDTTWSPYQKLNLEKLEGDNYTLHVNNVGYMGLLDLSIQNKDKVRAKLQKEGKQLSQADELNFTNQYDLPFLIKKDSKQVLIIGAGGGNDVAGAVRAGVPNIDAVEIDPAILELGKKYHPGDPYASPTVNTIVNDGRAYLRQTNKKYDIVIMALADSHTLNSSTSNVQLDNYLYTKESIEEVKRILNPDGILVLSYEAVRPWIGARIKGSVSTVFERSRSRHHLL